MGHESADAPGGMAAPSPMQPATVPGTRSWTMDANGSAYRISVALPPGDPRPPGGLPTLYLLDANAGFATVAETQRRLGRRPDATRVGPAIVVGIGHPGDALYDAGRRRRDYTPGHAAAPGGGAEAFLAFIEERVKPAVAGMAPVDPDRQILVGHSLAGYFALWVLTRRAAAFQGYVAVSPSLWRDETLKSAITAIGGARPRVFIAAGEWEEKLAPWQAGRPDAGEIAARRAERRMVGRARDFAAALAARVGPDRVSFALFPGEDHASVFAVAVSRAMRMMLEPAPGG